MKKTGPTPAQREVVDKRAKGRCERCGGVGYGQVHHRQPRKMGGTSRPGTNLPSNLLRLCRACHEGVEKWRARSIWLGWLVPEPTYPGSVAVKLWDGWFYLDDGGGRVTAPAPATWLGPLGPTPFE